MNNVVNSNTKPYVYQKTKVKTHQIDLPARVQLEIVELSRVLKTYLK